MVGIKPSWIVWIMIIIVLAVVAWQYGLFDGANSDGDGYVTGGNPLVIGTITELTYISNNGVPGYLVTIENYTPTVYGDSFFVGLSSLPHNTEWLVEGTQVVIELSHTNQELVVSMRPMLDGGR